MKNHILRFYYICYDYEAFIMNDALGDDFGCSYIDKGKCPVPFWIDNKFNYIKSKLNKRICKNHEYSQVITLKVWKKNG